MIDAAIALALVLNTTPVPVDYQQVLCAADVIYAEARSQPVKARIEVASAIFNRGNPCEEMLKPHQFAVPHNRSETEAWKAAFWLAVAVQTGAIQRSKTTHFHDRRVRPKWTKGMRLIAQSGNMLFWAKV